jgi:hypothetical protein
VKAWEPNVEEINKLKVGRTAPRRCIRPCFQLLKLQAGYGRQLHRENFSSGIDILRRFFQRSNPETHGASLGGLARCIFPANAAALRCNRAVGIPARLQAA